MLRHVGEVSGNVAATCRYYGISRPCYYGTSRQCCYAWRRRFDEKEWKGLNDRTSLPHHQPTKTDPQAIEKIL